MALALTNGNNNTSSSTVAAAKPTTTDIVPVMQKKNSRFSFFKRKSSGNLSTGSTAAGSQSQSASEVDENLKLSDSVLVETWDTFLHLKGPKFEIGITFTDAEDDSELDILHIESGSAAAKAGLKQGDIITELDGVFLECAEDFSSKMKILRQDAWTAKKNEFDITLKVRGGIESGRKTFNSVDKNGNVIWNGQNESNPTMVGKSSNSQWMSQSQDNNSKTNTTEGKELPKRKGSFLSRFSRKKSTDENYSTENDGQQKLPAGKYESLEEQHSFQKKKDLDLMEDLAKIDDRDVQNRKEETKKTEERKNSVILSGETPDSPTFNAKKRGQGSRIEYDENGKKILPEIYYVPTSRHIRQQTDCYFGAGDEFNNKGNTTLIARMSKSMDLNEINDINGKKSQVLMLEDKKTVSESLAKRFDRKADELIEQQNKADESDDPDFWRSECISRKRNLSLNSDGDAVINIADPKKAKVVEKWEDQWDEEWADEEWEEESNSEHEEMKIDFEDELNLAKHVSSGKFTKGSSLPGAGIKGQGKKGGVLALENKKQSPKAAGKGGVLALEDKKGSNSNVLALEDAKKPVNTTAALQQLQMVLAESREQANTTISKKEKESAAAGGAVSQDDIDLDLGEERKAQVSWDALYNFVFNDQGEQKGYDELLKNHDLCLNDGNLSLVPKKSLVPEGSTSEKPTEKKQHTMKMQFDDPTENASGSASSSSSSSSNIKPKAKAKFSDVVISPKKNKTIIYRFSAMEADEQKKSGQLPKASKVFTVEPNMEVQILVPPYKDEIAITQRIVAVRRTLEDPEKDHWLVKLKSTGKEVYVPPARLDVVEKEDTTKKKAAAAKAAEKKPAVEKRRSSFFSFGKKSKATTEQKHESEKKSLLALEDDNKSDENQLSLEDIKKQMPPVGEKKSEEKSLAIENRPAESKPLAIENKPLAIENKSVEKKPLAIENTPAVTKKVTEEKKPFAIENKVADSKPLAIENKSENKSLAIENKSESKPLASENKSENKALAIENKSETKALALEDQQKSDLDIDLPLAKLTQSTPLPSATANKNVQEPLPIQDSMQGRSLSENPNKPKMIPSGLRAQRKRRHDNLLALENNGSSSTNNDSNSNTDGTPKNSTMGQRKSTRREEPLIDSEIYANLNKLGGDVLALENGPARKEDSEPKEDEMCICCTEVKRDTVFLPCGHMLMCHNCSRTWENKCCPTCRKDIKMSMKVYL